VGKQTKNMSDTPRTDEYLLECAEFGWPVVDPEVARELERENTAIRSAISRLCRAVSRRMQADDPTPEDRLELIEAYGAACALLVLPNAEISHD
jgi:hypothetical protein